MLKGKFNLRGGNSEIKFCFSFGKFNVIFYDSASTNVQFVITLFSEFTEVSVLLVNINILLCVYNFYQ